MAIYNTSGFTLSVNGVAITGVVDASVSLTLETVDVSEIGNLDRKHVGSIRSGSAQGNLFYDQTNAQVSALEAAVKSGAPVALVFTLHSGATYTVATAYVTSWAPSVAVADVVKVAFTVIFSGEYIVA